MGYRDGQGFDEMQCGQESNGYVCAECQGSGKTKRKPLSWRRRIIRVLMACVVALVGAIVYAVARGMPVPDAIGQVLGVCLHIIVGM